MSGFDMPVAMWVWDDSRKRDVFPSLPEEIGAKLPMGSNGASPLLDWLLEPRHLGRQKEHLRRYFTTYSGRYFESFIREVRSSRFTPWDILAIEALSVSVPSKTAYWLLQPDRSRDSLLDRLQSQEIVNSTLWSCDVAQLRRGGTLSDLYDLLRKQEGLGVVTTSKLLAAKFPAVVPIRDSRVEDLIGMTHSLTWWEPIRQLFEFSGTKLHDHLAGLPIPDDVGEVSVLRRLDVILWMESRARDQLG